MPRGLQLALVFLAGGALGAAFFGGLAWTVRRWVAGGGVLLVLGSFLLRSATLLGAFWLLSHAHADAWIACLIGFTAARMLLLKSAPLQRWRGGREEEHASHS
jgi:F1F0 ATPase subunit 2